MRTYEFPPASTLLSSDEIASLREYYQKLSEAEAVERKAKGTYCIGRVRNPAGVTKTLWIPFDTSNRSATIDLNHELHGFGDTGWLTGENGNCMTPYVIIPIPSNWDTDKVEELARAISKHYEIDFNYRNLHASDVGLIIDTIKSMA